MFRKLTELCKEFGVNVHYKLWSLHVFNSYNLRKLIFHFSDNFSASGLYNSINHFRGMLYWVIQARGWEIVRKVNSCPRGSRGQVRDFEDNLEAEGLYKLNTTDHGSGLFILWFNNNFSTQTNKTKMAAVRLSARDMPWTFITSLN